MLQNHQYSFANYISAAALESIVEISNKLDYYRNSLEEKLEQLKISDQVLSSRQFYEILVNLPEPTTQNPKTTIKIF